MARRRREELRRELVGVEERLEELLDCITPENKDLISGKMTALRDERDRLKAKLADTNAIEERTVASTKLAGRMMKLAGELRELWDVATLAEKKEFISFMTNTISIKPRRKELSIRLSSNYADLKRLTKADSPDSFLLDGRGDWPNFEPSCVLTPFLGVFLKLAEPHLLTVDRLARRTA